MAELLIGVSLVLPAGYSVLMLFYYSGWVRTISFKPEKISPATKVSVIVAARNEEANIENCVRSILNQDYPKELVEVIVVDDNSEDGTFDVLQKVNASLRAQRSNPQIECGWEGERGGERGIASTQLSASSMAVEPRNDALIIVLSSPASGKKGAIEFGIQNSKGELIITTDADCVAEKNWISTVVAYYEKFHPKMIAAPVAFVKENSWIEKWQSLDLCGMMAITAGAITNGFPNMCNGANLAYEKKVFEEVGGFDGIDKLPSGDDVMLMMKVAKKYPGGVHFLKSKEAIVFTQTEKTFSGLFQQRLRWLSKGTTFPDWRVSAVLVFSWLFNLSILLNCIAGYFVKELWLIAAISLLIKTLSEFPLLAAGCSFFGKEKLLWKILPAQVAHILYVVIVGGLSRILPTKWKGRVYT